MKVEAWWRRVLTTRLVAAVSVLLLVAGGIMLLLAAPRGFDLTDEGFYVLGYRYADDYQTTSTFYFLILRPFFLLSGESITILRVWGFVLLLGAHVTLALSVVGLFKRSGHPIVDRPTKVLLVATISSGMLLSYSFVPLTPSYNQLAAILVLLGLAAEISWISRPVDQPTRSEYLAAGGLGACVVLLSLTKWPSLVALAPLPVLQLIASRRFRQQFARFSLAAVLGAGATAAIVHLLLRPIPDLVSGLRASASISGSGSHSSGRLLRFYRLELGRVAEQLAELWPIAFAALIAGILCAVARSRLVQRAVPAVAAAGIGVALASRGWFDGGSQNLLQLGSVFPALLVVLGVGLGSLILTGRLRSESSPSNVSSSPESSGSQVELWGVFGVLVAAPLLQSVGTSNNPFFNALFAAGSWFAAVWVLGRCLRGRGEGARSFLVAWVVLAQVAALIAASTGTWRYPYRLSTELAQQTSAVSLEPLRGLRVSPQEAAYLESVAAALREATDEPAPVVVGFWRVPGLIYASGARTPVRWLTPFSPGAAVRAIEAACRQDTLDALLVTTRSFPTSVNRALERSCGLDYPADFELVAEVPIPPERGETIDETLTVLAPVTRHSQSRSAT